MEADIAATKVELIEDKIDAIDLTFWVFFGIFQQVSYYLKYNNLLFILDFSF